MKLELHDADPAQSLVATIPDIDSDHTAEQWIRDTVGDPAPNAVIKWSLLDEHGIRCVWERPAGQEGLPEVTIRSGRFKGHWHSGPNEEAIP